MILPFNPSTKTVRCSIGTLLSLCLLPETLRGGDDSVDLQTRLKHHNRVQKAKAAETGGTTEVQAKLKAKVNGISFHLSGRADVVCPGGIWEVKTRSPIPDKPLQEHLLQLCFYMKALKAGKGWLLYTDTDSDEEKTFRLGSRKVGTLWKEFIGGAARLVIDEWRHHECLKESLGSFSFPFQKPRPGQEQLFESTRRALESSGESMIQAPTGTGKTAAVLFGAVAPAIRTWNTLFFLTAKNTQKKLALETAELFRNSGLPFRAVALSSRRDTCPMNTDRCLPETCSLAEVFGERVQNSGLLEELLETGIVDTAILVEKSLLAGVCPFETGLCLAQRCDLVICDYNHVFDPSASLKRFFAEDETAGRIDLLVDEAPNLPDRVMRIWSPEIWASWLRVTGGYAGKDRKLRGLVRPWIKLMNAAEALLPPGSRDDLVLPGSLSPPRIDFRKWRRALKSFSDAPPETLDLSRAVARFSLVAERLDDTFHLLARREQGDTVLQWFCTDPSGPTGEVHRRCRSVTAFSATLSPAPHFRPLLGMGDDAGWTVTEWPFPRGNLRVWIDATIDTRWKARESATPRVAERLRGAWLKNPGTWLAWFPSFSWMEEVALLLGDCSPLVQPRASSPEERRRFLEEACEGGKLVLSVAGGVFSEGVDMTFPDLKGGFVAGPSLPSVNTRQELVRVRYNSVYGDGFLHAYIIPGMNRVIQAAGRLLRNPEQKADLVLLGQRFTWSPYRELLPEHWLPARVITLKGVTTMKGEGRSLPP